MTLLANLFGATLLVVAALFPIVNPLGGAIIEPHHAIDDATDITSRAFYPLTLPLTVGSISVAVALGANTQRQMYGWPAQWASTVLGPFVIALSIFLCFRSAERVERWLGRTGMSVFMRLSAFIILCIGIQLLWNGIVALAHLHV